MVLSTTETYSVAKHHRELQLQERGKVEENRFELKNTGKFVGQPSGETPVVPATDPPHSEDPPNVSQGAVSPNGGLSVPLAAAFLLAEMSGSGILAVPKGLANTGWAGIGVMAILCFAVGYSGIKLAKCWVLLEERWPEYRLPCRRPYPVIAYRALGKPGLYMSVICQMITLIGVSTVTLVLSGDLLSALAHPTLSPCQSTIILAIILAPLSWFGTPKDFWPISVAGVVVAVVQVVVVLWSIVAATSTLPQPTFHNPTFSSFFLGLAAVLFSFGGASTFPTIQNDMMDRSKFTHSVYIAFPLLLILYVSTSSVGYAVLGSAVPTNILRAVSGVPMTIMMALFLAHLLLAFVILANPVSQGIEEILALPQEFGWRRCLLRTLLVVFESILGLAIPDFGLILNLLGGSTITIMSFVLPPLCYLKLAGKRDDPAQNSGIGIYEKGVLYGVTVIGIICGIIATYTSVAAIITPGVLQRSCFG